MMCRKHLFDTSSDVGVCASCLREKLFPILAAQSDSHPPPLISPCSVSPPHVIKSNDQNRLFHRTPKLGPISLFGSRLKKPDSDCSVTSSQGNEPVIGGGRRRGPGRCRGMSPARVSDCGGDDGCDGGGSSGNSSTGRAVPATVRGRGLSSRDVAGFAFCLSPLVRARPKKGRSTKSMPPEVAIITVKPQRAEAEAFCKNRSRKIADFGRMHRRQ